MRDTIDFCRMLFFMKLICKAHSNYECVPKCVQNRLRVCVSVSASSNSRGSFCETAINRRATNLIPRNEMPDGSGTKVVQMQSLFGHIGQVNEIRLYPTFRRVSCLVVSWVSRDYFESSKRRLPSTGRWLPDAVATGGGEPHRWNVSDPADSENDR
ncbi:uncharacterized protein LOC120428180 isoform X1 [Culex pipiens pallens]|uniref:uncharacterized protein LOC120428180 isoform X1 n=1 Tax=Culex pipiens pallens TaxID=42434 RepID=UPI001953BE05|nr:uncharacterized protein LOC120428180 isoform X1 [Culex pipiens pallens]